MLTGLWLLCFLLMISFLSVISIHGMYIIMCTSNQTISWRFFISTISIRLFACRCNLRTIYLFLYCNLCDVACVVVVVAHFSVICMNSNEFVCVGFVSMCISCISCICVHICRLTVQVTWIDTQISYCILFKCGHCNFYECFKTWSQIIHWR